MTRTDERFLARRRLLQGLGLSALGLSLPRLLEVEALAGASSRNTTRAKSCIFLFLGGGPSQLDTWDLKPKAPSEIRGEFQPIATSVPGTFICEHLPRMAQLAKHYTIIRSLHHHNSNHGPAGGQLLTGVASKTADPLAPPAADDPPGLGSLVARLVLAGNDLPSSVMMPARLSDFTLLRGQSGGWLGSAFDPMLIQQDPNAPAFRVSGFTPPAEVPQGRVTERRQLLSALEQSQGSETGASRAFGQFRQRAFDLLTSGKAGRAFDLSAEPHKVRERYGRTTFGQGCLLARRLIEAGVRTVTVTDCPLHGKIDAWDTHANNFRMLKDTLLPRVDQAYTALLEDLLLRGLYEETVVYLGGEFGRTPKINGALGGRDHWPWCFPGILAGGLIRPGAIYGSSDSQAAYPRDNPVTPEDLAATLLAAMGLDPGAIISTRDNRPVVVSPGTLVKGLLM
jgi:Protein of unknown function (DUF1501)